MESIAGMKELNQKLSHIDRSLERISKALEQLVKIQNKRVPPPSSVNDEYDMDDEEDE